MTREMRADRYAFGEQFGEFILNENIAVCSAGKSMKRQNNRTMPIRYFFFPELLMNFPG
jgi:hypothetical protein